MRLKDIKTIDVYTRWWHDEENGNPYYARKVVVNKGMSDESIHTVKETWGDVNGIENDHLERILKLPKSVSFTRVGMSRKIRFHYCNIRTTTYTYHDAIRIYKEKGLEHPERFRNQ